MRIFHDREGQTLTVWFGEPTREHVCEQITDEVVLMKDRAGRVIGVEELNFLVPESDSLTVALDIVFGMPVFDWLSQHPDEAKRFQ